MDVGHNVRMNFAGIGAIAMAMVQRTPKEEAMLIEAFGDSYRRYCERTGRFFPRLH